MSLTYLRPARPLRGRKRAWYRCGCGKELVAQIGNVKSGYQTSCGCSRLKKGTR